MRFPDGLVQAHFVRRDNRFRATVELDGRPVAVHVPNSGRLRELFTPGRPVLLLPVSAAHRKTDYDLILVQLDGVWVSMDAQLPVRLFAAAVVQQQLAAFAGYAHLTPEVRYADSRLDFLLQGRDRPCWVEVKSVTLVEDGTALFPDAVTARGRRHLMALMHAVEAGDRAAVVFIIQRPDAQRFAPHDASDPAFGVTLRQAVATGVEVYAYTCQVNPSCICIAQSVPVIM